MKYCFLILAALLLAPPARSEVQWNRPNVAPYITPLQKQQRVVVQWKVKATVDAGVKQKLFSQDVGNNLQRMAMLLIMEEGHPSDCKRTQLTPDLKLALMSSGQDKFIPNVVVGKWAARSSGMPVGAWMCRINVPGENREVYLVIPDVCDNLAIITMRGADCIVNPTICDKECERYVLSNL